MSFWDDSWGSVDMSRVTDYIESVDIGVDAMVSEFKRRGYKRVCDAGCGCGIYSAKLAANGFVVSGFDVSAQAVEIAKGLLRDMNLRAELKTASVTATGYDDEQFDLVISRDVLDHISKADATAALAELRRITKRGGAVVFTVDGLDEEYETEPHTVNADGDYLYNDGKWNGMVFHPYSEQEILEILPSNMDCKITSNDGEMTVWLTKCPPSHARRGAKSHPSEGRMCAGGTQAMSRPKR